MKKDSFIEKISAQKQKTKPSKEGKKKKRPERSLSPIYEERRTSKTRLLKNLLRISLLKMKHLPLLLNR